jgi:hypothetical protein
VQQAKVVTSSPAGARGTPRNRQTIALVVGGALVAGMLALVVFGSSSSRKPPAAARTTVGVPEPYARPIALDINGDGEEDVVLVTSFPGSKPSVEEREVVVQAIDGRDGHVLYALAPGESALPGARPSVALVARGSRLGVANVLAGGPGTISIHEIANGRTIATLALEPATGRVCQSAGGSKAKPKGAFLFEGVPGPDAQVPSFGGRPVSVVDLDRATVNQVTSSCGPLATTNVADGAMPSASEHGMWPLRFSPEVPLRKGAGPYGGNDVVALPSGLAFLVVDGASPSQGGAAASDAGTEPPSVGPMVVGLDLAQGITRFERSLESTGVKAHAIERIEATEKGPLFFFGDDAGIALLDAERGDRRWSLELPKEHRLASYTLSPTRIYLHVFVPNDDPAKRASSSKILVVDLASGALVRSLPG